MTPAIDLARKYKISHQIHQYQHDPQSASYALEAAEKLDRQACQIFKTLIVCLADKTLAVAVIPVTQQLNMKRLAKALNVKKAVMADKAMLERATGYVLGGISPLGQKKRLKTVVDQSADQHTTILVSAGKRGLEIELSPADLLTLTNAFTQKIT